MDCITLLACIYLDVAIGAQATTDRTMRYHDQAGIEREFKAEEIPLNNPLAQFVLGVELPHGFLIEVEHASSIVDSHDRGFSAAWIKKRFYFGRK